MPIVVDYTPVGALSNLAALAGRGAGKSVRAQRGLALLEHALAMRRQQAGERAQNKAFALQSAMAGVSGRAARTPISPKEATRDSAFDRMVYQAAQKKQTQEKMLEQLNRMKSQGVIDDAVFEQNKLRIMGGQAISIPRQAEPTTPVGVRRAPYASKIRMLQNELERIQDWKYASNPEDFPQGGKEGIESAQQRIQNRIDELIQAEQRAFSGGQKPVESTTKPATVEKPPGKGQWEGQRIRNTETGTMFEWHNGKWDRVS